MKHEGKWAAASDALRAAFDDMYAVADPATFVVLYLYPKNKKINPKPLTVAGQHEALYEAIVEPEGSTTPTDEALQTVYTLVEGFNPPRDSGMIGEGMKKVVVLVSDGVPSGGEPKKQICEDLASDRHEDGIITFSVGIGPFPAPDTGYDPKFMSRMAQAGGTAPAGCDPESTDPMGVCHFQITPEADVEETKAALIAALNTIRQLAASCEFEFKPNADTDLGKVSVIITDKDGNRVKIPRDPVNGWAFDDPNKPKKILLRGDACAASGGTISGRIDVVAGCTTAK
jgi:hypothetical protein